MAGLSHFRFRRNFHFILLSGITVCLIPLACTQIYISDTLIPDKTKRVPEDYALYDGMGVAFKVDVDAEYVVEMPSSLSGRRTYQYKELQSKTGIVVGEFEFHPGNYFIIRLEDESLVKVPSKDFFKTTYFAENN